jgi:L-threonylcarbamoyladenylate synthase
LFSHSEKKPPTVTEIVSIERDGALPARRALEQCVNDGGVAIFPADTLYGLACDPARPNAIESINALKDRDPAKPSAVMFFSPLAMRELVSALGSRTRDALAALLPGPVTLVVANPERRYPHAGGDTPERLGVRLIEGPLSGATSAVFQTSANRAGQPAPSRFEDIDPEIIGAVDVAIDGGDLGGAPSTVVDLGGIEEDGGWSVLREGAMPLPELERRLGALGLERR